MTVNIEVSIDKFDNTLVFKITDIVKEFIYNYIYSLSTVANINTLCIFLHNGKELNIKKNINNYLIINKDKIEIKTENSFVSQVGEINIKKLHEELMKILFSNDYTNYKIYFMPSQSVLENYKIKKCNIVEENLNNQISKLKKNNEEKKPLYRVHHLTAKDLNNQIKKLKKINYDEKKKPFQNLLVKTNNLTKLNTPLINKSIVTPEENYHELVFSQSPKNIEGYAQDKLNSIPDMNKINMHDQCNRISVGLNNTQTDNQIENNVNDSDRKLFNQSLKRVIEKYLLNNNEQTDEKKTSISSDDKLIINNESSISRDDKLITNNESSSEDECEQINQLREYKYELLNNNESDSEQSNNDNYSEFDSESESVEKNSDPAMREYNKNICQPKEKYNFWKEDENIKTQDENMYTELEKSNENVWSFDNTTELPELYENKNIKQITSNLESSLESSEFSESESESSELSASESGSSKSMSIIEPEKITEKEKEKNLEDYIDGISQSLTSSQIEEAVSNWDLIQSEKEKENEINSLLKTKDSILYPKYF